MTIATTQEILEDIRHGRMVVLVDAEDRENEGDLVMAADFVTPDAINFMARHARGLICLTLEASRCRQLNLPLMVTDNRALHGTAFTASIEAATGVTSGISAADRARTVQVAVAANAKPDDIVQPGHIFPVMAKPGERVSISVDMVRLPGARCAARKALHKIRSVPGRPANAHRSRSTQSRRARSRSCRWQSGRAPGHRKRRRQHGRAAAAEHQRERAEEFGRNFLHPIPRFATARMESRGAAKARGAP